MSRHGRARAERRTGIILSVPEVVAAVLEAESVLWRAASPLHVSSEVHRRQEVLDAAHDSFRRSGSATLPALANRGTHSISEVRKDAHQTNLHPLASLEAEFCTASPRRTRGSKSHVQSLTGSLLSFADYNLMTLVQALD